MSPAGGVGINLAIQDAVAAANLLAVPLLKGLVTEEVLAAVQQPARVSYPCDAENAGDGAQGLRLHF